MNEYSTPKLGDIVLCYGQQQTSGIGILQTTKTVSLRIILLSFYKIIIDSSEVTPSAFAPQIHITIFSEFQLVEKSKR